MSDTLMVNILLTRKCNLKCEYCDLVKDYETKPKLYKKVLDIKERESDEWIEDIELLLKNHKNIFVILYGGEPFLYQGLPDIVDYLNRKNVPYTIITNGTIPGAFEKIIEWNVQGLSCSVDPMSVSDKTDRSLKTDHGYQLLKKVKESRSNVDVTAEITCDDYNIKYLPALVEKLTKDKIWSSITICETKVNQFYDFASSLAYKTSKEKIETIMLKLYDSIKEKDLLVHVPELLKWLPSIAPNEFKNCGGLNYHITIEPDGYLRLCLRIGGQYISNYTIKDLIKNKYLVESIWNSDKIMCCQGCAWTCSSFHLLTNKNSDIIHK